MAAFALEKGEPIFAALSHPTRALEILSGDDDVARTYSGRDEVRAMKAIALAFLLRRESAARELSKVKHYVIVVWLPKTHRYRVTETGRTMLAALFTAWNAKISQLSALAVAA